MADIQHRDIPDDGLHEIKGAVTALIGSVPVADGVGGTTFQKIGVGSLTGSLPTNIPDITITTDGLGGFKSSSPVYAYMQYTDVPLGTDTLVDLISPRGIFITGSNFQVQSTGVYQVNLVSTTPVVPEPTPPASTLVYKPVSFCIAPNTVIESGGMFLITLTAGVNYTFFEDCKVTIQKVQ